MPWKVFLQGLSLKNIYIIQEKDMRTDDAMQGVLTTPSAV